MNALTAVALTIAFTATAAAQGPGGPGGMGQRPQLPDHWLTIDSLAQAVALTPAQREKVTGPYNALNTVLKQGATKRAQMRERMGAGGAGGAGAAGGGGFRDMSEEQRQAMRARMDSLRAELQPLQDEADQYYQAIRAALTPEQQTKLDALPKPLLLPPMRPRP